MCQHENQWKMRCVAQMTHRITEHIFVYLKKAREWLGWNVLVPPKIRQVAQITLNDNDSSQDYRM